MLQTGLLPALASWNNSAAAQSCCQANLLDQVSRAKFSSRPELHLSHYEVLGVSHTASVTDIKAAFRKKVKLAHPDTSGRSRTKTSANTDFARLLAAYQVLTNARERQLYDLGLDPRTGRVVRQAASNSSRDTSASRQQETADFGWAQEGSWAAWAANAPAAPRPRNEVDCMREELRAELRSALRHAYLGPELELEAGQLPECFEGDERSETEAADILQLVSGRQLLGVVREHKGTLLQDVLGSRISEEEVEMLAATQLNAPSAAFPPDSQQYDPSFQHRDQEQSAAATTAGEDQVVTERVVLELEIGSEVAALGLQERFGEKQTRITIFDGNGKFLSLEEGGLLLKGGRGHQQRRTAARSPRKLNATHSVLRGRIPLVRHLQFLGYHVDLETECKPPSCKTVSWPQQIFFCSTGEEKVNICRCRRAWLPPSNVWLFPPRSPQHCSRSWYFEWPGYKASQHHLWLHPAVFVLTAAFESLKEERAAVVNTPAARGWAERARRWAKAKLVSAIDRV